MKLNNDLQNHSVTFKPSQEKDEKALQHKTPYRTYFWTGAGAIATYKLFDEGLANLLNLETLTHGTGPKGFIGINLFGADPNYGGSATGSSQGNGSEHHIKSSRNYFYVFKDTELPNNMDYVSYWGPKVLPRMHAVLSGLATFGSTKDEILSKPFRSLLGIFFGAITPILKFRFRPEDIVGCTANCRFQDDPDYSGLAYRTAEPISPMHLGIIGSLIQGINLAMFQRMASNPLKLLKGATLLVGAYQVGKATYHYYKEKPPEKPESSTTAIEQKDQLSAKPSWKDTAKKISVSRFWGAIALTVILI